MKNWNYINGAEIGNAKYDIVYQGHALSDAEIEKIKKDPANKSKLIAEYKDMVKQGVISLAEFNAMQREVGNATIKFYGETIDLTKASETDLKEILEELHALHEGGDEQRAIKEELKRRQTGNSGIEQEFFKKLADDAKKEEKKDDKEVDKLVGNYQTGTSKFKAGDRVSSYGAKGTVKSIKGENSDNIYGEPLVEVEFDNGKTGNIPEHYLVKIGNSKCGNGLGQDIYQHKLDPKQYMVVDWDNKVTTIIVDGKVRDVIKNVDNLAYVMHLYKKVNKVGNKYTEADRKRLYTLAQKQKTAKLTDAEWKELQDLNRREEEASKELLKRTGNSIVSEYNAEIQRLTRKAEQLRRMGQGKSAMEVEKQIEKLGKELYEYDHKPTKNSASDDKFANVMREFDEGKLKTPDGKVVTDPAQAKAIAYSESKKAENGLARARNAMNKRTGNKGRINFDDDIVVIKKNGNILYKGMQDYADDDDIRWQYNEAKGIYEAPGGLTKEKIG